MEFCPVYRVIQNDTTTRVGFVRQSKHSLITSCLMWDKSIGDEWRAEELQADENSVAVAQKSGK